MLCEKTKDLYVKFVAKISGEEPTHVFLADKGLLVRTSCCDFHFFVDLERVMIVHQKTDFSKNIVLELGNPNMFNEAQAIFNEIKKKKTESEKTRLTNEDNAPSIRVEYVVDNEHT